jgi:hypothetical protein
MVEPEPVNRFPDAKTALEALQPLYIIRVPDVTYNQSELRFVAAKVGEKLSQKITLKNTVSETILQGQYYVVPHPSDPPHTPDDHVWISITPKRFESHYGEDVTCTITIDTSKLKADNVYKREIVLESNAKEERIRFEVSVETAKIKFDVALPPYLALLGLGVGLAFSSMGLFHLYGWILSLSSNWAAIGLGIFTSFIGAILGGILGLFIVFEYKNSRYFWRRQENHSLLALTITIGLSLIFGSALNYRSFESWSNPDGYDMSLWPWENLWKSIIISTIYGIFAGMYIFSAVLFGLIFGYIIYACLRKDFCTNLFSERQFKNRWTVASYILLTSCFGISTGLGLVTGFTTYLLAASVLSAVSLTGLLIYPPLKLKQLKSQYHQQESQKLIEP